VKYLHLIWSNLKRKKLRTILTLLSIVVAFILFGFLFAIKQALAGGVAMAGQNRLVVRHKVSIIQSLPESYKARMERIPEVADRFPDGRRRCLRRAQHDVQLLIGADSRDRHPTRAGIRQGRGGRLRDD
jgi:hypothetical protein